MLALSLAVKKAHLKKTRIYSSTGTFVFVGWKQITNNIAMILRGLRKSVAFLLITFLVGFSILAYKLNSSYSMVQKDGDTQKSKVVKDKTGKSYENIDIHVWESEDTQESAPMANVNANVRYTLNRKRIGEVKHLINTNPTVATDLESFVQSPEGEDEFMLNTENLDINQAIANFHERRRNLTRDEFDQFVILTTVDSNFIHLMENWRESLKRRGLKYNITLICEDDKAYKFYVTKQNRHFKVLNTHDYEMLGKLQSSKRSYQQLIKRRTLYVRNLLFTGTDVLLVDIDAVWLKDPIDIIRQSYQIYDVWVAEGFEPRVPCPCFLYMKAVPSVMKLAGQWMHRLSDKKVHPRRFESDQFALQYVLKKSPDIRLCSLDKVRFPTGKEFFDPEWNLANLAHVYIAHGNHLGRKVGKVDKFKEFGLWLLNK